MEILSKHGGNISKLPLYSYVLASLHWARTVHMCSAGVRRDAGYVEIIYITLCPTALYCVGGWERETVRKSDEANKLDFAGFIYM